MPEWLIERGIGETRAALIEDGEIVEARIELDGVDIAAGTIIAARLVHRRSKRDRPAMIGTRNICSLAAPRM